MAEAVLRTQIEQLKRALKQCDFWEWKETGVDRNSTASDVNVYSHAIVDASILNKPKNFSRKDEARNMWYVIFKSHCGTLSAKHTERMEENNKDERNIRNEDVHDEQKKNCMFYFTFCSHPFVKEEHNQK
eukprot:6468744-Amphidinium_carterae.1